MLFTCLAVGAPVPFSRDTVRGLANEFQLRAMASQMGKSAVDLWIKVAKVRIMS